MRYLCVLMLCLAAAASAEKTEDVRVEVKIQNDDGSLFSLDSDTLGFDMSELQVGENRSYIDDEGRSVLLTRTDSGFTVDVDGQSFDLPVLLSEHELLEGKLSHYGVSEEVEKAIRIAHEQRVELASNEIRISSGDDIDAATQAAIKSALQAGGYDKEVKFVSVKESRVERQIWVSKTEELEH